MLTATAYFGGDRKVTSALLADSIGTNSVIVRTIMGQLQDAALARVRGRTVGWGARFLREFSLP
ncbi:MAG: hypothetical protein PUF97_00440 [Bifidobacteriaceae bacterium]|nr:hypothetical protein [Bifidobacteriaceae bacterium]